MTHRVLYNPLSANKKGMENAKKVESLFPAEDTFIYDDVTKIKDLLAYLGDTAPEEQVILAGGDGTVNHLANLPGDGALPRALYYFPCGTGNDFYVDVKEKEQTLPLLLNPYLENLPTVTVNGMTRRFLNGIGFGIDGYCCEVGDRQRAKSDKPVNYTAIAIKGLLFHYQPANATVTVDGVVHKYNKVWVAPSMNGRFYGGGMMIAPSRDRLNKERTTSFAVGYGVGKLKMLTVFPGIFKGAHMKHTEMFEIISGHDITVEFDRPCALQIDGETVLGVTSYRTVAGVREPAGV